MAKFEQIRQHFAPGEQDFVKQALDQIQQASNQQRPIVTDFLNPRQRYILSTLVQGAGQLQLQENGLFAGAEAARVVIAPDYYDLVLDDFDLTLLELSYPQKFAQLRHKDLLGALVHAGLARNRFGDLVFDEGQGKAQVAVESALVPFIEQNISSLGKTKVTWQTVPATAALVLPDEGEERFLLLPSLRLDAVVAAVFHLSRTKVSEFIAHGQVRVNWAVVTQGKTTVGIKDLISVRKKGRCLLLSLAGSSKNDKIKANFKVIER
ncbi:YlmH/Sll1252 family protein [Leuconostocaceae bacterium ESL0958]|nr:YlmH/Sll1252 family protein [Leuconostocaceae bacterium ESL0958]